MRWTLLRAAIALAISMATAPAARAADENDPPPTVPGPLPWQDPGPFARMFLQLPFQAPETVRAGTFEGDLRILYSNSILVAGNDTVSLEIAIETAQPTVLLQYGLTDRIELQLAIPVVVDYGGVLDRPIELVEGWFNTSNPERLSRPLNLSKFRVTGRDGSGVARDGAGAGLGDVWTGAKVLVLEQAGGRPALAVRAAVKAPTGSPPSGSGELDAGGGILAGWSWRRLGIRMELDVIVPTGRRSVASIETQPYGAAQVGLAAGVSDAVAFHLQWSSHRSPLTGTGLHEVDSRLHYLLAGLSVALSPSSALQAGVIENVFSQEWGADITFLFSARARF